MQMRRQERQVTNDNEIDSIILECDCVRLGFADEEGIYIVPMSFGFNNNNERVFYFHGAREGRKSSCIDHCIQSNTPVAFELDCAHGIKRAETACGHSAYFKSVMGNGRVKYIENNVEKKYALNLIMEHEAGRGGWDFPDAMLSRVAVFCLTVIDISCKASPAPQNL